MISYLTSAVQVCFKTKLTPLAITISYSHPQEHHLAHVQTLWPACRHQDPCLDRVPWGERGQCNLGIEFLAHPLLSLGRTTTFWFGMFCCTLQELTVITIFCLTIPSHLCECLATVFLTWYLISPHFISPPLPLNDARLYLVWVKTVPASQFFRYFSFRVSWKAACRCAGSLDI